MCSTKEVSPEEESSDVTATPEGTEQTHPAMNGNAEDLSMQAYTNIHAEAIPQADAKRQFSAGSHDAREFACEVSCTMKTCVREKPSATAVDVGGDGMDAGGNGAPKKKRSALTRLSAYVTNGMEGAFERHGRRVAANAHTTAALCMVFSALCSLGSFYFVTELRPYSLWLPQDSEFIKVLNWQSKNFPNTYRRHVAFWEADNILTARAIQEMWRLHVRVADIAVGPNATSWDNLCARVPSLPTQVESLEEDYADYEYGVLTRRRRDNGHFLDYDMSLSMSREDYCATMDSLPKVCLETSLLEVWGLDEERILNLTDEQVLEDINSKQISEVFGYGVNFTKYLGSISYDEEGRVVSAGGAIHVWVTTVDHEAVDRGNIVVDQGNGELVDVNGFAWEDRWVKTVLNDSSRPKDIRAFAQSASSFGKVSDENIWGDVKWLVLGFSLMCMFVNMTLGRRNLVQQRPMLAFMGMVSVAQAIAVSYGLCSLMGIPYCPVNSILPILLIGLGVDDMFVIMAAWESVGRKKGVTTLTERAGVAMRHAGVAITVTSLTDVTAFAVGATTDLPALRSFCIYAAVGIFAVYILQSTFFLAWLVRDERRMEENKNGFFWCITHKDWKPWACSKRDLLGDVFKHGFCPFILSAPMRAIILLGTGALVASSIWSTMNLRKEFNAKWFIPKTSYLHETFEIAEKHFPDAGQAGYLYFANVSLPEDLPALNEMIKDLEDTEVIQSIDPWFSALDRYIAQKPELTNSTLDYALLQDTLSIFLQSSSGASYRRDFKVDGNLDCRAPAPPVTSFRISFMHLPTEGSQEESHALQAVKSVIESVPIKGFKAAWAQAYSVWETNEVVGHELWRNMILAAAVVGVVTLILLASFWSAMLVLACVAATVVGVSGTMAIWGLTVDTVSCIALVLAIGLSVDYAAHISHAFLAIRDVKDRKERARAALEGVGPAVLQGGFSTLLSFILLAGSSSHVFITFFKVFTAASVLGLYYGLVFLPVILSFVGPEPYADREDDDFVPTTQPQHDIAYTNDAFTPDPDTESKIVTQF
nr:patched domain-containing protein 3-like [Penaeus vannamei]